MLIPYEQQPQSGIWLHVWISEHSSKSFALSGALEISQQSLRKINPHCTCKYTTNSPQCIVFEQFLSKKMG